MALGDRIRTLKGYAFKSSWYSLTGVPIVKVSDLTTDSIDTSALTCIPQTIAAGYSRYALRTGDVIIQTVGSWPNNPRSVVGKVIQVPPAASGALLNQNAVKLEPDTKLDKTYLFYLLKTDAFKRYIVGCAQGAASQASITLEAIRGFRFSLPPLPIQRHIASILSAYDDLIENNTRRIAILEEMAQRLYCEWFVEYRFPGHEGVRMVESELGLVPEGWEIAKLKGLVSNVRDTMYAGPHLDSAYYVPIDVMPRHSLALTEYKPGREAQSSLIAFQHRDILFGAMRSYFHKVVIAPFDGITRSTCFVLRPYNQATYSYAVLTLFQDSTVAYASSHSRGSTIPYAVWEGSLAEMPVVKPTSHLIADFNDLVEPLLQRVS